VLAARLGILPAPETTAAQPERPRPRPPRQAAQPPLPPPQGPGGLMANPPGAFR